MGKERPSYYSIIPADVRYDDGLKANEKLLYSEITALSNKKGYCWSENKYFADLYNVKKGTVSGWVSNLEKKGYIRTRLIYQKGSKQVSERRIYITVPDVRTPGDKNRIPYEEKNEHPMLKKSKEELITTSTNTTSTNKDHSSAKLTERFESLWKLYPRKQGKKDALKHYKRAVKEGTTDDEIEAGIQSYVGYIEKNDVDKRYVKHGSAWFNQEGWLDDYEIEFEDVESADNHVEDIFSMLEE